MDNPDILLVEDFQRKWGAYGTGSFAVVVIHNPEWLSHATTGVRTCSSLTIYSLASFTIWPWHWC